MSEEPRKIDKPESEEFKKGRKLYFAPLFYVHKDSPSDYKEKLTRYLEEVEQHISNLEAKLGQVSRIFHELTPVGGENGAKVVKDLNDKVYGIIKSRLDKGARLEATEDAELLTEFMD